MTTEVLAHWSTVKPAHRVSLWDGTEIVASGEHRFLSAQGWKHVTTAGDRPFLGDDDELCGFGRKAPRTNVVGTSVETSAGLRVLGIETVGG